MLERARIVCTGAMIHSRDLHVDGVSSVQIRRLLTCMSVHRIRRQWPTCRYYVHKGCTGGEEPHLSSLAGIGTHVSCAKKNLRAVFVQVQMCVECTQESGDHSHLRSGRTDFISCAT